MRHTFTREQFIDRPLGDVFAFFADANNLQRITPAWLRFEMVTPAPVEMRAGARIDYRIRLHHVPIVWKTLIREWDPPHRFVDAQIQGPYRVWEHTHEFAAVSNGTLVRDVVEYELPAGWLGEVVRRLFVARDIAAIFDHRRAALSDVFRGDS